MLRGGKSLSNIVTGHRPSILYQLRIKSVTRQYLVLDPTSASDWLSLGTDSCPSVNHGQDIKDPCGLPP